MDDQMLSPGTRRAWALMMLTVSPDTSLQACRSFGKAVAAIDRIELGARENGTRITGDLVPAECNLEDLASIRRAKSAVCVPKPER